ncbi:MAG: BPL-N domain-containing protein [Candidatus Uhrbacteria bacterium]|nr:BPL-N domain-containing protein [Candidatus Uhrbacteria bacterium]
MKNIFVYTGKGAYQARDIEAFLAVFDYDYERICEHDFAELGQNDLLIVPGGAIKEYEEVFGAHASEINEFITDGGTYIGICAGVSALSATGLIPKVNHAKGFAELSVTDSRGDRFDVLAENPPELPEIDNAQTLLSDKDRKPVALGFTKGQGTILLLAVHTEGSVYYNKHPKEFSGAKFLQKLISSEE